MFELWINLLLRDWQYVRKFKAQMLLYITGLLTSQNSAFYTEYMHVFRLILRINSDYLPNY